MDNFKIIILSTSTQVSLIKNHEMLHFLNEEWDTEI